MMSRRRPMMSRRSRRRSCDTTCIPTTHEQLTCLQLFNFRWVFFSACYSIICGWRPFLWCLQRWC